MRGDFVFNCGAIYLLRTDRHRGLPPGHLLGLLPVRARRRARRLRPAHPRRHRQLRQVGAARPVVRRIERAPLPRAARRREDRRPPVTARRTTALRAEPAPDAARAPTELAARSRGFRAGAAPACAASASTTARGGRPRSASTTRGWAASTRPSSSRRACAASFVARVERRPREPRHHRRQHRRRPRARRSRRRADARYRDDEARAFVGPARIPALPDLRPGHRAPARRALRPALRRRRPDPRARRRARGAKKVSGSVMATVGDEHGHDLARARVRGRVDRVLLQLRVRQRAVGGPQPPRGRSPSPRWPRSSTARRASCRACAARDALPRAGERKAHPPARTSRASWSRPTWCLEPLRRRGRDRPVGASSRRISAPGSRFFRDDLRLAVDPTVPFSSGSYNITSEGLPARREVVHRPRRLLRPIVGLKYAKRLGIEAHDPADLDGVDRAPRPVRGSRIPGARVSSARGSARALRPGRPHPGHGRAATSRSPPPQAIVVRDGRARGRAQGGHRGELLRRAPRARDAPRAGPRLPLPGHPRWSADVTVG